MKVFITGTGGFIAKEVINQCRKQGIEVFGVDFKATPDFPQADIRSKEVAKFIPEEVDAIIHLAGLSNDTVCKNKGYESFDLNVLGTLNLMNAAIERKAKQFIFASTEWVYDNCTVEDLKNEESIINIANHSSEYALTKLVSEANLRQKFQHGFCPVTILRFGIVCGDLGEKKSAVEALFLSVRDKDEVTVGSLKTGRCFIHVSDIASGIIKSIGLNGFNIINLGGDKLVTLREIIEMSEKALNKKVKVTQSSPDNVSVRNISSEKIKKILGWKPEITVDVWLKKLASTVAVAK